MSERVIDGYMRVVCQDGPRKGREYYFRDGVPEFGINSPVPGDVRAVYEGGRMSGYGQYIYKVVAIWGASYWTKTYAGMFDRLAYA